LTTDALDAGGTDLPGYTTDRLHVVAEETNE
jgi:hypothetical protein